MKLLSFPLLTGLITVNGDLITRAPLFDLQVEEIVASEYSDRSPWVNINLAQDT